MRDYNFTLDNYTHIPNLDKEYVNINSYALGRLYPSIDEKMAVSTVKTNMTGVIPQVHITTKVNIDKKGPNGMPLKDWGKRTLPITEYISKVYSTGMIMAPSFTVYLPHSTHRSIHGEFTNVNKKERSIYKGLGAKYKIENNSELASYYNILQATKKIFNNSLSGGYSSNGTVITFPSIHYTLTSTTRMMTSLGNAISESFTMGNRIYTNVDTALHHIATIIYTIKDKKEYWREVLEEYDVYIPTKVETLSVITRSTKLYWNDVKGLSKITKMVSVLDDVERAALVYMNDFYHFTRFNPAKVKQMLAKLTDRNSTGQPTELVKAEGWISDIVADGNITILKGKNTKTYTTEDIQMVNKITDNIYKILDRYFKLFHLFYITELPPPNISNVKDMVRRCIGVSDTDSNNTTYMHYSKFMYGESVVNDDSDLIASFIGGISSKMLEHYLKVFINMANVKDEQAASVLAMKPEYHMQSFIVSQNKKEYGYTYEVQEGKVFDFKDPKKHLVIKGVGLIMPTSYKASRELATQLMFDITNAVKHNKRVNIIECINKVLNIENEIYRKIHEGSTEILKLENIKPVKGYKNGAMESPYQYHIFWNEVFGQTYIKAPEPPYIALKLNTTLTTKNKLMEFISNIEDIELKDRFYAYLQSHNKGSSGMGVFRIPLSILQDIGIPKEITPVLDVNKIIRDNCNGLYKILDMIGMYTKPDSTLTESMGMEYRKDERG